MESGVGPDESERFVEMILRHADLGLVTRHPPTPVQAAGTVGNRNVSPELRALVEPTSLAGAQVLAVSNLSGEGIAALAVAGASKLLQREIDPKAHADLIEQLAREIEGAKA